MFRVYQTSSLEFSLWKITEIQTPQFNLPLGINFDPKIRLQFAKE